MSLLLQFNFLVQVCILTSLVNVVWLKDNGGFSIPDDETIGLEGHFHGTKPLHYQIHMKVLDAVNFKVCVKIYLEAVKDTKEIFLNAGDITRYMKDIKIPTLKNQDTTEPIEIAFVMQIIESELVVINLNGWLRATQKYILDFQCFSGTTNHSNDPMLRNGISLAQQTKSRSGQFERQGSPVWLWTTLFQMRIARRMFPCYDHPALKATFSFCIDHEKDIQVYSNTEILMRKYSWSAWPAKKIMKTCFKKTPVMSTYLFTFAVGKGLYHSKTMLRKSQVHFELICVPSANCTSYDIASKSDAYLSTMQKWTGFPYPLKKLGNVLTSKFFPPVSAEENFGLIATDSRKLRQDTTTAHEIVHQWIGNLVTVTTWDNLCLQEGLTTYLGILMTTPNLTFNAVPSPLDLDTPLITSMRSFSQARMCYSKAPTVFYLLEETYGSPNDPFMPRFMHELVRKCKWSNCNLEEWKEAMTSAQGGNQEAANVLASLFETPGFPVIVATVTEKSVVFEQTVITNSTPKPNPFFLPLHFTNHHGESIKFTMDKSMYVLDDVHTSFDTPGSWFSISPKGLYGVIIYPVDNYLSMVKCFKQGEDNDCGLSIPLIERLLLGLTNQKCNVVDAEYYRGDKDPKKWQDLWELIQDNEDLKKFIGQCISKIIG